MSHCEDALQNIYAALKEYRLQHEGYHPDTLEILVEEGLLSMWDLVCPACSYGPGKSSYQYRGCKVNEGFPGELIIAYCKDPNHKGRRNVLFMDGHTERPPEKVFQSLLKKDNELRNMLNLP